MAYKLDKGVQAVHGVIPTHLIEAIVRDRIFASTYWKEKCFGLNAADLTKRAIELEYVGGTFGENRKATPFICLLLKMLMIQPEKDIVMAWIMEKDFRYIRLLGLMYLRLVGNSIEIYKTLETFYSDSRKFKYRKVDGSFEIDYIDNFVDKLLHETRVCETSLPAITNRQILVQKNLLGPRTSIIDEEDVDDNEREGLEVPGEGREAEEEEEEGRRPSNDGKSRFDDSPPPRTARRERVDDSPPPRSRREDESAENKNPSRDFSTSDSPPPRYRSGEVSPPSSRRIRNDESPPPRFRRDAEDDSPPGRHRGGIRDDSHRSRGGRYEEEVSRKDRHQYYHKDREEEEEEYYRGGGGGRYQGSETSRFHHQHQRYHDHHGDGNSFSHSSSFNNSDKLRESKYSYLISQQDSSYKKRDRSSHYSSSEYETNIRPTKRFKTGDDDYEYRKAPRGESKSSYDRGGHSSYGGSSGGGMSSKTSSKGSGTGGGGGGGGGKGGGLREMSVDEMNELRKSIGLKPLK